MALALGELPATKPGAQAFLADLVQRCFGYADESQSMAAEKHVEAFRNLICDFKRFTDLQTKESEDMPRFIKVHETFDEMSRCVDHLTQPSPKRRGRMLIH